MSNSQKPDLEENTNVRVSHRDVDREAAAAAREMTLRENGLEPISGGVIVIFVIIGLLAGGVLFKDTIFNYGATPDGYRREVDPNSLVKGPPIGEAFDAYFKKGQELFGGKCASCHGGNGSGSGTVPPLAGSEWVKGENDTYVLAIASMGAKGEFIVKGKAWNGNMPNAGAGLSDYELGSLSTYLRNSFGHDSGVITGAEQIKDFRERMKQRKAAGVSGEMTSQELKTAAYFKDPLGGERMDKKTKVNKKTGEPAE